MIETREEQQLGRAKNAVQDYFIKKLLVPKIYFDVEWFGQHLDVLAVDRAGVGDVHAVRIIQDHPDLTPHPSNDSILVLGNRTFNPHIADLKNVLAHFRYAAVPLEQSRTTGCYPGPSLLQEALAIDGVGRVGVLFVDLKGDQSSVMAVVTPERFRTTPEMVQRADKFVAEHTANWEVRD